MVSLLVVDDMEFMRNLLTVIFKDTSDIDIVAKGTNGTEGVDLYKEHEPDVVLMNIRMPIQDGISATDEITDYDPDATIIMCSGNRQEMKMQDAVEAGASDYVTKPFQKEALVEVIEEHAG